MRLGTETGSVTNHLLSGSKGQPVPVIGMGVTFLSWTDRHPGTIQEIFTNGKYLYIGCTRDSYVRTDDNGMSESQSYEYTEQAEGPRSYFRRLAADPNAPFEGASKGASGRWKKNGYNIRLGDRERYFDFSF